MHYLNKETKVIKKKYITDHHHEYYVKANGEASKGGLG
jgi:hypothetical protein